MVPCSMSGRLNTEVFNARNLNNGNLISKAVSSMMVMMIMLMLLML